MLQAKKREIEEKMFLRWVIVGQEMSFDEFKKTLNTSSKVKSKPTKEILNDVFEIIDTFNQKGFKEVDNIDGNI